MKPMLFNTQMVRAILDGRKTQTRRLIPDKYLRIFEKTTLKTIAPYRKGDILYVRETWGTYSPTYGTAPIIYYRADENAPDDIKWRPSIHMPKEAARIFLRVTNVKVERLNEMRLKDCLAEGVRLTTAEELDKVTAPIVARERFSKIWDSTIKPADLGRYGWGANPWVWVYECERGNENE